MYSLNDMCLIVEMLKLLRKERKSSEEPGVNMYFLLNIIIQNVRCPMSHVHPFKFNIIQISSSSEVRKRAGKFTVTSIARVEFGTHSNYLSSLRR